MCSKVTYPSQRKAAEVAHAAGRRYGDPDPKQRRRKVRAKLRAYKCPNCNGWHLSSSPQR
jgi:hypothetical protein